jgi:hypothetical protein
MSSELCECPVCLEEIGDNNRITTQCGHTFHASCIIRNLHTSPLCPMCRTVLDDSPNAQNQLEDLDDETLDTLVESILFGTRSNHRITNNIMIYVDNYLNGSIAINRDGLRRSIASTIGDYANEFAFDYTHMLRDWASESLLNSEIPEPPPPPPPVEVPLNDVEEEYGDGELSDPPGLNPLVNALDNYAIQSNIAITNNDYNNNAFNLDNHIYNQIEFISNAIPIATTGLTLRQVETLLME